MNNERTQQNEVSITICDYSPETDAEQVCRIWREIRWLKDNQKPEWVDGIHRAGRTLVAKVDGVVECATASAEGRMRYLQEDLPLSAVTAVTTGIAARRMGLALQTSAQLLAKDAEDYAEVAMLGVFDQGFYDKLGFGAGPYQHATTIDPSDLKAGTARRPVRITLDDWQEVHSATLKRFRVHGGCNLLPPETTRFGMNEGKDFLGLGYRDGTDGRLSHFFWGEISSENGPLGLSMMCWQTMEQFKELLALLKSLSDQIWAVSLLEPAGIQFERLLSRPLKRPETTEGSDYAAGIKSYSEWQMRILDIPKCVARMKAINELKFNMSIDDPIKTYLPQDIKWRGTSGDWIVSLGERCRAEKGNADELPTLKASIGAFSRLWMGAAAPISLVATDKFDAPWSLIESLNEAVVIPSPQRDWPF